MVKIYLMVSISLSFVWADNVEQDCLSCHKAQQIPSELIYRRYLMRYSTEDAMQKVMLAYLKNPTKSSSIMPPQFFLKFPMKEALDLDDRRLADDIQGFLETFDIKKKLILGK